MKFDYLKNLALISQLGLMMVIPIFLCVFFGIWLDDKAGTGIIFTIVFMLLGVFAGFRNMFVIVLKKTETGKKDQKHGKR